MSLVFHRTAARSSTPTSGWTTRLLAAARATAAAPARFYRNRALLDAMAQMSAYELRDIGLTPQDVSAATALPLGEDPSRLFVARAAERRMAPQ